MGRFRDDGQQETSGAEGVRSIRRTRPLTMRGSYRTFVEDAARDPRETRNPYVVAGGRMSGIYGDGKSKSWKSQMWLEGHPLLRKLLGRG